MLVAPQWIGVLINMIPHSHFIFILHLPVNSIRAMCKERGAYRQQQRPPRLPTCALLASAPPRGRRRPFFLLGEADALLCPKHGGLHLGGHDPVGVAIVGELHYVEAGVRFREAVGLWKAADRDAPPAPPTPGAQRPGGL